MGFHGGLSLVVVLALLGLDASLLGTFVRVVAHLMALVACDALLLHPRLLERVVSACEASVAPVLLPLPNVGSRLRASGGGQVP